jgi:hypothetical protein
MHTDIHALSGIRTHDPSIRASEDSSCLRRRGHWDRHFIQLSHKNLCVKHTGNSDEMAMYFNMPRNYNVDVKGAKEVKIRSSG